ncbi:sce7726 family protein [Alkalihalobacillus macyae]|uniref:sce7726 family protein n=1 Tax=Guptibacillus hwajinpoensis TaxID=208199 RepID=UPI00273A96B9|nr:sce7726 family protein [Alkalihalobacillus macyae]MDP4553571.1 sce7726 family protein [Alkalihalobacillus macyae]
MQNRKNDFEIAQFLANQYSTFLSNETIERKVIQTFNEDIISILSENRLTPREFLNQYLLQNYPNETSVKSSFINNVLLKSTNHVSIFELKVGKSRLDLCKINKFSTAFEIKTELDSPYRLHQQMKDYFLVFEKVYLICSIHNLNNMLSYVPDSCGIYSYYVTKTGKYIFKKQRSASKSNCISPHAQLEVLTKKDLNMCFKCPNLETKKDMIDIIMKSNTNKEINTKFKQALASKYYEKWNFLLNNKSHILEMDYQWFFKNRISPKIVYL